MATFVIVRQIIFWGGLSLNIAFDRFGRRFLGLVNDDDIVNNPEHILETNAIMHPKMKCLVVDDDEISLQIMKEMLISLGHRDTTACISAPDALDVLDRNDFDCLFLDVEMPIMDGITLCDAVRARPAYKDVPIVMVTAKTGGEHVKAAFRAGATDYITKPYTTDELASRISAMQVVVNKDRSFDGVDRFISLTAMDNFLLQIERGGLFATNVLTIKVEGFELFQRRASSSEMKSFLRAFAVNTMASLSDTDSLVAYAGKGVLACVTTTRAVDIADLEYRISELFLNQCDAGMLRSIGRSNVTVSAMESIILQEREGKSVFRLHCKIYEASEPHLCSRRSRKTVV